MLRNVMRMIPSLGMPKHRHGQALSKGRKSRLGVEALDGRILLASDPSTALSMAFNEIEYAEMQTTISSTDYMARSPLDGYGQPWWTYGLQPPGPNQDTVTTISGGSTTTTTRIKIAFASDGYESTLDYETSLDQTMVTGPQTITVHMHFERHSTVTDSPDGSGSRSEEEVYECYTKIEGGDNSGNIIESHNSAHSLFSESGSQDASGALSGTYSNEANVSKEYSIHATSGTNSSGTATGTDGIGDFGGFTLDFQTTATATLHQSGGLTPGSSDSGDLDINYTQAGNVGAWAGDPTNATVIGSSMDDSGELQGKYDGSQPQAQPVISGDMIDPPTTVSPNDQQTALQVPRAKFVVTLIDKKDMGWQDWDPAARARFLAAHPEVVTTPTASPIADGSTFDATMAKPEYLNLRAHTEQQAEDALDASFSCFGAADVLIIADHGGPGGQYIGVKKYAADSSFMRHVALYVRPGGMLILTGCQVMSDQAQVDKWQALATEYGIYIRGSVTLNTWYRTGTTPPIGVWITLQPGGTAPRISQ